MRVLGFWLATCSLAAIGCSDEPTVTAVYTVPDSLDALAGEHFLDHPLPSDFRLKNGAPSFVGFHNPRGLGLVDEYAALLEGLIDGFSPAAAGYLRFDGALDPRSLPENPLAATAFNSSVQLIDVDPSSAELGTRRLIDVSFRAAGGHYLLPNTLRWMPTLGFPLRPGTRYALVCTDDLRAAAGGPVESSPELRQVLGIETATGARAGLANEIAPVLEELGKVGLSRERIVNLAVFRTGNPTDELQTVRDHLVAEVPAPNFTRLPEWSFSGNDQFIFVEYLGFYGPSPNYQRGELPFAKLGDGGDFNFVGGEPAVVDLFELRTSIAVPGADLCPMPEGGYPIALHAHGTGGDYRSHVESGWARALADRCVASMGIDQIFHGTRPGAQDTDQETEILFYNFQNGIAARTNARQAALDEVQRARLFTVTGATIPAEQSHNGEPIRFDGSRLTFFGHSQGGLNGPLYLAVDDSALGGVLSGAGANINIALLEKNEPKPAVADLVRTVFLGLTTEEYEELDLFHPALSLAQTVIDVTDPVHYARLIVTEPRPGYAPKSIYMSEGIGPDGIGDSYAPPRGIESHAVAIGLPLMLPAQREIRELAFGGPEPLSIPPEGLSANLAGGAATGVLAQWAPPAGVDGHFVIFDVPEALAQSAEMIRSLGEFPPGTIPPP